MESDKLLYDLVSINSANLNYSKNAAGEKEIGDFIYDYFKKNNIDCIKQKVIDDRSNIVAKIENKKSKDNLLFCSHLDTVYLEGMDFKPKIVDGKLFGPGSCDTKASLAAIMNTFIEIKNDNIETPNLYFAGVISEEMLHIGVRKFIEEYKDFNSAIMGEPTSLNVGIAHKGSVNIRIITKGKSAHSSVPENGINAIYNMEKLISKLRTKLIPEHNKKIYNNLGTPTLNIGVINGGTAFNIVPDFCSIGIDRRIIPGETLKDIIYEFEEILNDLRGKEDNFFAEIENNLNPIPCMETNEDEKLVKVAYESTLKFNKNAEIQNLPYTTDGGFLSELKIPTIVLGPGNAKVCHELGEYMDLDQLFLTVDIYKDICMNY